MVSLKSSDDALVVKVAMTFCMVNKVTIRCGVMMDPISFGVALVMTL